MTSFHVRLPPAAACVHHSTGCPLARRARVKSVHLHWYDQPTLPVISRHIGS